MCQWQNMCLAHIILLQMQGSTCPCYSPNSSQRTSRALVYVKQASRGKKQTSGSLAIFLWMQLCSVLVLLWENSCCNNNFHFYESLMLNKQTDYLFKHHFIHQGNGAAFCVSVLQHYSKTQGRCTNFSVCDSKWLDFQMSRAPESISSYKQPRSGRIPVDFHQCSARFENHDKIGGCLGKLSLRQISLETGSNLPCTRTWLTTPLSTTIFSKKVPENLFFPQENTFFCL